MTHRVSPMVPGRSDGRLGRGLVMLGLLSGWLALAGSDLPRATAQGGLSGWSGWSDCTSCKPPSSSNEPSKESTVKSSNQLFDFSASSEVKFSHVVRAVSNGAAWSDASRVLGTLSRTGGRILLAFSVHGSAGLEPVTRMSLEDIRSALGAGSLARAPRCSIESSAEADWKELQHAAPRILAESLTFVPRSLLDYLVLAERIAHHRRNAETLTKVSRSLFSCGAPDPDEKLRGAAAIVLWAAAFTDWDDAKQRPHATAIEAPVWQVERRRALAQAADPALPAPGLCLAMSGGGIRSAAFQLGALQALTELGLLDEVDVASAVSGGSYTLAWLVGHKDSREVLRSEAALEQLDRQASHLTSWVEGAAGALLTVATQPLRRVLSALLETSIPDPTVAHYDYERRWREAFDMKDAPLSSLVSPLRPFPIFVATARRGEGGGCATSDRHERPFLAEAGRLKRSVFEMTPLGGGSEQLGFSRRFADDVALAMAVATTGAALDDPYDGYCRTLRSLGVTLGIRLGLWRPDTRGAPEVTGEPSEPLHLSDGGFSDNLGIYPLVRRSCQRILVLDATWDPHLTFDAFQRLREALSRQQQVSLESDALLKVAGAHSERCLEECGPDCFVHPRCGDGVSGPVAARLAPDAVFEGVLRVPGEKATPLHYVKLAVDEAHLEPYPRPVQDAIRRRAGRARDKAARERLFPHIPTTKQVLRARDFQALRLLGCYLVEKSFAGERNAPPGSPCQP
jgi:hypothetical protein